MLMQIEIKPGRRIAHIEIKLGRRIAHIEIKPGRRCACWRPSDNYFKQDSINISSKIPLTLHARFDAITMTAEAG